VNLFIQQLAEQDILSQVEWYARQGVPEIAIRFHQATMVAIDARLAMPEAGPPRLSRNPQLAGMRTWLVKGFDESRVYYVARSDLVIVVRNLHSKRDVEPILEGQAQEEP
jgi:toxin ParE1/3/4